MGSGDTAPPVTWRRVVSFTTRLFYAWKRATDTHWRAGWVDRKAGHLTLWRREKSRAHAGNRTSVNEPVAVATPVPVHSTLVRNDEVSLRLGRRHTTACLVQPLIC
jgi:hypothetical protein